MSTLMGMSKNAKNIVLLLILLCGVDLALTETPPSKEVQNLLASLRTEELHNVEFIFLPSIRLIEFPNNDESIVFDSIGSEEIPLEERSDFLFSIPPKECITVWGKIKKVMLTGIPSDNASLRSFIDYDYFISVRLTFGNQILYVSTHRFNQKNITIRKGDTRILLEIHAMKSFLSIFDKYIEHPILKKSLYKYL